MGDVAPLLFAIIILLLLSAFFSSMETAYSCLNKLKIKTMIANGNARAEKVLKLAENFDKLISTILVGNNIVNITATSLAGLFFASIITQSTSLAATVSTIVTTVAVLIFGEITPKSLATQNAESIAFGVCRFIKLIIIIFTPVVAVLNVVSGFFVRLFGGDANKGPTMTEEDLKTIVTVSHEEGVLEDEEKEMIHNVFEFGDTEIKEVMTPRIHVESISSDTTYDEVIAAFRESQFSRLPVHNDSYDEIIGVLYIKDLFLYDINRLDFDVTKIMRDTYFVYEFNQISDVFEAMRKDHISLAVVLDEYGVMSGIVTLEDIVEEIVGEIDDEYDEFEQSIVNLGHGEFLIDGSLNIDEVNDVCETNFDSEDFESIGGLVLGECNGSPEMNQTIIIDNVEMTIKEIDKNRIVLLHLKKILEDEEKKGEEKQD